MSGIDKMTKRVAVIGYAHRFPGEVDGDIWNRLLNGDHLVTTVAADRFSQAPFTHPDKAHPGTSYTFAAGSIGDIAGFDADFFGISPREAALMDPQQRLLLEMSWEALENAGVRPSSLRGTDCGVFIGIASADYFYRLMDDLASVDSSVATGNTSSIAANRLSYFFDLRGPSIAIDTACSSSLVAFHQACQSILAGESTHALTGGVSLHIHPSGFISFSKASMLSRKGRCNVFDADGDGYVRSEGGGILYLKDYDAAVADGNRILAVVAASAVNTDGRKSGLTVPSATAQAALLKSVYAKAKIAPEEIDYIEAHGTGTAVGDPIETRALGAALGVYRSKKSPLLIGSVKSNMGHLEAASGVAGLVKSLLAIQHREVPGTIGIRKFNPNIDFDAWNLKVATAPVRLKSTGKLTVGTNSFGFGGANAHVILQSYESPEAKVPRPANIPHVPVVLSAKTPHALEQAIREFAAYLKAHPSSSIYDIAYSSCTNRDWHAQRAIIFGNSIEGVQRHLNEYLRDGKCNALEKSVAVESPNGTAFVYSGNGSQWIGMGRKLLSQSVHFRNAVAEVDSLFKPLANFSLLAELAGEYDTTPDVARERLARTEIAQPALFAVQVGITSMLRQRGVIPAAVVGHSVGEVAAAWASGALTLAAAVKVIYHRSKLQGTTRGNGLMAAVNIAPNAAQQLLDELRISQDVVISGFNGPHGVTLAGSRAGIETALQALVARRIAHKRLDLDYAFHSPAMDGIEVAIESSLDGLKPTETTLPMFSTVTGDVIDGRELLPTYWWYNIRQPVLFSQAIDNMIAKGFKVFVEIGPHAVLRSYIRECLDAADKIGSVIPTLTRNSGDADRVWSAASRVIIEGAKVDWSTLLPWRGRLVSLPNYPWQRETHWTPPSIEASGLLNRHTEHPLLGYRLPKREPLLVWESRLDPLTHQTLSHHVVGSLNIFPGSGYAEIAAAAALSWHRQVHRHEEVESQTDAVDVESLEIHAPLVLSPHHTIVLQTALDPDDGSVKILARDEGSANFTLHATARVASGTVAQSIWKALPPLVLPSRSADFTNDDHENLTLGAGLQYGTHYRLLSHGWVDSAGDEIANDIEAANAMANAHGSATALFSLDETVRAESKVQLMHPAVLDCAFQLIIHFAKQVTSAQAVDSCGAFVYVPVRIDRMMIAAASHDAREQREPFAARADLERMSDHAITAHFMLFDNSKRATASLTGVRFQRMRLDADDRTVFNWITERLVPMPHPSERQAASPHLADTIIKALDTHLDSVTTDSPNVFLEEVDPLVDELARTQTYDALKLLADAQGVISQNALARFIDKHGDRGQLDQLLRRAEIEGLSQPVDLGWQLIARPSDAATAVDIWSCLVQDYPDYFSLFEAPARIGAKLVDVMRGDEPPATVDDRVYSDIAAAVWSIDARKQLVNILVNLARDVDVVTGVAANAADTRTGAKKPFKVLEILQLGQRPLLAPCFADATVEHTLLQYQFVSLQSDTESNSVDVWADTTLADVVLITHGASDDATLRRLLSECSGKLADNGALMILSHQPMRWLDWVLAHASGVSGQDVTHVSARNSLTQRHQLTGERLDAIACGRSAQSHAQPANAIEKLQALASVTWRTDDYGPALHLLRKQPADGTLPLQESTEKTTPRQFIFAHEPNAFSECIAQALADLACTVKRQAGRAFSADDPVVYIASADAGVAIPPSATQSDASIAGLTRNALSITTIARHLLDQQSSPPVWVISPVSLTHDTRAQSRALRSWLRTLANEMPQIQIRFLEVETADAIAVATTSTADRRATPDLMRATTLVVHELLHPTDDVEVFVSNDGVRRVPRMSSDASLPITEAISVHDAPVHEVHLRLPQSGQLKELQWSARESQPTINAHEVEVQVCATGLNFRDVMLSLGVLTEAAVEDGFAGATLGLEFAGIVTKVGEDVSGYQVGDRVLGFGAGCFASHLRADARSIAHIPGSLSFEAAATIPCTFFTAYYALKHMARVSAGESVLIHGAAGGVGLAAIQVAQYLGADVFATAGTVEKRDVVRMHGAARIYDSRTLDFADEIARDTGGVGVDVVLNSLAGEAIQRNLRILKPFGRFIELGKRDFYENTKIGLRPFRNNISYFGVDADQLMQAHPALTQSLFAELMSLFANGTFHALPYRAYPAIDVVDAFRCMQQSRHIGKIVVNDYASATRQVAPLYEPLALDPSGTYLVTGGLSGFGLKTAEWLVSKGAKHVTLISRRGAVSEEAKFALHRLWTAGAKVEASACDVTHAAAVSSLFAKFGKTLPPLRGIVHAAMVIDDGLATSATAEQIARVLQPKIVGAKNLREQLPTLRKPLDFFVLYSSATTLFGNPGQGSYVAANAWLEEFAESLRNDGTNAIAVAWGAIDDAGYLARNKDIKEALQKRMGGHAISSATAFVALEQLLSARATGVGVLPLDWDALSRFLPTAKTPRFEQLASNAAMRGAEKSQSDIAEMLQTMLPEELQGTVLKMIQSDVADILRIQPDKIDPQKSVFEMGLDSLMGVELVTALESRFGIRLPAVTITEAPTLSKLTTRVINELKENAADAAPSSASDAAREESVATAKAVASQHGQELSEMQLSSLLNADTEQQVAAPQRMIR